MFRIRMALMALICMILCLGVATAASGTQAATSAQKVKFTIVKAPNSDPTKGPLTATFTTAKFTFATNVPTTAMVNTGTDWKYMLPTPDRRKIKHVVTVPGLMPNTSYDALITATDKTGKTVKTKVTFQTAAPGTMPATVTSRGNKLLLNGSPFFAMVAGFSNPCLDPQAFAGVKALKAFIIEDQEPAGQNPAGDKRCTDTSTWQDPSQWGPWIHTMVDSKFWWTEDSPQRQSNLQEQKVPEALDWKATDVRPSWKSYSDDPCSTTTGFFEASSKLAKTRPVVMGWGIPAYNDPGSKGCTTPALATLKFWSSVAADNKGVRWYPEDFQNFFDVESDVQTAIGKASLQMGSLGPCVTAGSPVTTSWDINEKTHYGGYAYDNYVRVGAWKYGNTICVVAVNTTKVPERVSFTVPSLTGTSAQVFWEGRRVSVKSGTITDSFAGQGFHRYVAVLPLKK